MKLYSHLLSLHGEDLRGQTESHCSCKFIRPGRLVGWLNATFPDKETESFTLGKEFHLDFSLCGILHECT